GLELAKVVGRQLPEFSRRSDLLHSREDPLKKQILELLKRDNFQEVSTVAPELLIATDGVADVCLQCLPKFGEVREPRTVHPLIPSLLVFRSGDPRLEHGLEEVRKLHIAVMRPQSAKATREGQHSGVL